MPSRLLLPVDADGSNSLKIPPAIKKMLLDIAKRKLPGCMGDRYTEVVVTCLTCLDEDNPDFGDPSDFEDDDGVLVGVRYIEKV